jgi:L-threonylcarbamoyladenylate synthase
MQVITSAELEQNPGRYKEVVEVLKDDGLICFPTRRQYVLATSIYSEAAVLRLVQSKRRSGRAPALALIPKKNALKGLVTDVPKLGWALMDAFWPGSLTLLLAPGEALPERVVKTILDRKRTKLGVRVCTGAVTASLLAAFGGPLLVSSANLAQKVGASSVAQIKKNFTHTVDLLIDAGDVQPAPPSTIVEFDEAGGWKLLREGSVTRAQIEEAVHRYEESLGAVAGT